MLLHTGAMNGEANMIAVPLSNVRTPSEKRKSKKGDKKNAVEGQLTVTSAQDAEKTTEQGSKKRKGEKSTKDKATDLAGLKSEPQQATFDGTGVHTESGLKKQSVKIIDVHGVVAPEKSPIKKRRKEKKDKDCPSLQEKDVFFANAANESAQGSLQNGGVSKKKSKKSKNFGHEVETQGDEVQGCQHAEELVGLSKQPMEPVNELDTGEVSTKKKEHLKELCSQGGQSGINRLLESKLGGSKDDDNGNGKDAVKERKQKDDNGPPNQGRNLNLGGSSQGIMNDENVATRVLLNAPLEKRKAKKRDKKIAGVGQPDFGGQQTANPMQDVNKETIGQGSTRRKREKNMEDRQRKLEGHKSEHERAFFDGNAAQAGSILKEKSMKCHNGHGMMTQREITPSEKYPAKRRKVKEDQDYSPHQGKEALVAQAAYENAQILLQNGGKSNKKSKKCKDLAHEAETQGVTIKSVSDVRVSERAEEPNGSLESLKQPIQPVNDLERGKVSTKKKKQMKEMCSQDAQDDMNRLQESKLEGRKDDDEKGIMKCTVEKRKHKEERDALSEDCNLNGRSSLQGVMMNEEPILAMAVSKVGTPSKKREAKKLEKKKAMVGQPDFEQTAKTAGDVGRTTTEQCSKKKKGDKSLKGRDTELESLKKEREKAPFDENVAQSESILKEGTVEKQKELLSFESSPAKTKKDKKDRYCSPPLEKEVFVENTANGTAQVLLQNVSVPKKKSKSSKHSGHKTEMQDDATVNFASDVQDSQHAVELDELKSVNLAKQSMEPYNKLETSSKLSTKNKKHTKEFCLEDAQGGRNDLLELRLEGSKHDDNGHAKDTAKNRKQNGGSDAEKSPKQDCSNLSSVSKNSGETEGISNEDIRTHDLGPAKEKNKNDASFKNRTPSGGLAFKRVDVDKVKFVDPRLTDNSYWAKDGAEEGYGARAQEVLGSVRGRDFRHEKTKKKRGSYRGGIIGLESHSIKFENSDDD